MWSMDQGRKKFQLKWPWNWLACGLFVAGAWWFLGIFSVLLAALFLGWQKKRHPDAVPQGGYCMDRTRKRLARLLWALLYLFFAFAGGVCLYMQMQEDRSLWEMGDWAFTIFSGVLCLGGVVLGLVETYMDLRDAFFPAKSRLAQSIRSQLPYPEEAPPVEELFAMVDKDIQASGQWFDRVAIGKEWVLGDDVSSIARIRGVFSRDEIKVRYTNGRRQSTRIVELWIVDDRQQLQCTSLRKPAELQAAVSCLRLRAPEARFDDYCNLSSFTAQTSEEWQAAERSFVRRRDQRLAEAAERERLRDRSGAVYVPPVQPPQREARPQGRLTLSDRTGATREYSFFTRRDVELAGEGLSSGTYTAAALFAGPRYLYLKAGDRLDGRVTVHASRPDSDKLRVFETKCTGRQAKEWLLQMFEGIFAPDFAQWKDVTKQMERAQK